MLTDIVAAVTELVQDPVVLIVAAVALLALAVALTFVVRRGRRRSQRRQRLQKAFGPEYDRTTGTIGRRKGERDLTDRLERHGRIERRLLDADAVAAIHAQLDELQVRFVDAPTDTVSHADELVREVAAQVGYPKASDRDRVLADISVDHPAEVAAHRRALDAPSGRRGSEPSTEELRASLLAARALLDAMLGPSLRRLAEVGLAPRRRELRDSGALAELLAEDDDHQRPLEDAERDAGRHHHDAGGDLERDGQLERDGHVEHRDSGGDSEGHLEDDERREPDGQDGDRSTLDDGADDVVIALPEHEHARTHGRSRADEAASRQRPPRA